MQIDPVELTADLIRCPSVTPEEGGAIRLLEDLLGAHGFACTRISRGGVENLYARWGTAQPVFSFGGHTDVVPVGDEADWTHGPFSGHQENGILWGRGATDMKSGVAAFVSAAIELVETAPPEGSVSLMITGDEEGPSTDGTIAILDWMRENGETADFCIVGEPTSVKRLGDTIKIGRRGAITGTLTVRGKQGHTAYPERALNPLPVLARICTALSAAPMDRGSEHFQASTLALASIDVGNPAANVIPAMGRAVFNVRVNDQFNAESVKAWVTALADKAAAGSGAEWSVDWRVTGDSFLTQPGPETDVVVETLAEWMQVRPELTTGGGTSDARFIKDLCPVVELGLVGDTMHQVDERVPMEDIRTLSGVYLEILKRYFAA